MQRQISGSIRLWLETERSDQGKSVSHQGGDAEGVGCAVGRGVRPGTGRGLVSGRSGGGIGGVGITNVGCLIFFADGGSGACRMTGAYGVAGMKRILTLVSGNGVRELMKNRVKIAMMGTTMMSTLRMAPRGVKRK